MKCLILSGILVAGVGSALAAESPGANPSGGPHSKTPPKGAPATQTPGKANLTLEAVLVSLESHYPVIAAALQDQSKAQADNLAAEGGFDPLVKSTVQRTPQGEYENQVFDASVEQPTTLWGSRFYTGYRQGRGDFGPYDEKLLTNSGGEVRAGVEVPLLRGGAIDERRARLATAGLGLNVANLTLASQKLDVRRQATQKYFEWVAAGDKLKIAQSLLTLAKTRDDAMLLRVRKGDAAAVDQVDNERSVLQREAALVSAERAFRKVGLELSLFYRDQTGEPIIASTEQLPGSGMESFVGTQASSTGAALTLTAQVVDQHPDLKRFEVQTQQNDVDVRLARNSILPKVDLDLGASKDMGDGSDKKARQEYKVAVKMELPLFQRTPRGRLAGALATGQKLRIQQDFAKDRLRTALTDSQQSLAAARDRLGLLQKEVELAAKVEKAELLRWTHGDSNLLMVNLREQATADARSRLVDAQLDYQRALADIQAIAAGQAP